ALVDRVQAAAVLGDQDQPVAVTLDRFRTEPGDGARVPLLHRRLGTQAEGAAGRELVGLAASVRGVADASAQDPDRVCVRLFPGQVGEQGESGEGGGAGTDDRRALAGVAGSDSRVLQVGDAVGDAVGSGLLTEGGDAVRTHRAGHGPGAGGVDDGAGGDPLLSAVRCLDVHGEGLLLAAGVDDPVPAGAGHAGDRHSVADLVAEYVRERLEVPLDPVAAGRVRRPSGRTQPVEASSFSAAGSVTSAQGENRRTWAHSRTAVAADWPASSTRGSAPRSTRCATAARPTGP